MKRIILIAFVFCSVLSTRAQEGVIKDFIISDPKKELKIESVKPISPINHYNMDYKLLRPNIITNPGYYQSNLDFNSNIYKLKHDFSYMLYNNRDILHGFGGRFEAGGFIVYRPFNNLTFSLGASGVKYSMNVASYNDFLFNASMTYKFNNWLKLHLYGQYSMNSQSNALTGGYYLSPQNCYGAVFIIKVADKNKYSINMNVSAERYYNPLNDKWEMNYRLGPEIRLK